MHLSLQIFVALLVVAAATAKSSPFRKQADADWLDKQRKVLKLYVGLGADIENKYNHEHNDFPFDKPELYTKGEVVEKWMKVLQRGVLPADGVFTMSCHRIRHDTFKLFNLLFFAKDFDTFHKIADWAKREVHPIMLSYALSAAVIHRPDTKGIYIPPLYEIHPHHFVTSDVISQAMQAKIHDVKYRKFEQNNTGWEWSYHQTMMTGPIKSGNQWHGDDAESRVTYFREDAGLSSWYAKEMIRFAPWISEEKYGIWFDKRGELLYIIHHWMFARYNLERYANDMPYVAPFDPDLPLVGYNPHLVDISGHSFVPRPDGLIPSKANTYGTWDINTFERRIIDAIDFRHLYDTKNKSFVPLDEANGLDLLGRAMWRTRDSIGQNYYQSLFWAYFDTINNVATFSNDREFSISAMNYMVTAPRDPAFWQILGSVDEIFNAHLGHFHHYSKDQLSYPGVKINSLEVDKLTTYFEHYDFEITNGIPFKDYSERVDKRYMVSKFRLNHKPFTVTMKVQSEVAEEAMVRVFIGPPHDHEFRPLTMNQQRHAFVHIDQFRVNLVAGENVIERNSHDSGFFATEPQFRSYYEKVNNSLESGEAFYYDQLGLCGAPDNLMIPRGSKAGKKFVIYAIITKYLPREGIHSEPGVCGHSMFWDQYSANFPFDRWAWDLDYTTDNMIFTPVTIYHKYGQEVNRTPSA